MSKAVGLVAISNDITVSNNDVSLATSELILPKLASDPANPVEGQLYYNTTDKSVKVNVESGIRKVFSVRDGASAATAATSATELLENGILTSGIYWLQSSTMNYPARFYCEQSLHGGGWIHIYQRYCNGDNGLYYSHLTNTSNPESPNLASADFFGARDTQNNNLTPQAIWNAFIGANGVGKFYAREIQVVGGTYDESQRYTSSTDGPLWSWSSFSRLFAGQFSNGGFQSDIKVWYNNGASTVTGKQGTTWSAPHLATINNGNVDQDLWFCNGEDGGDSNWSFGLMKGGTPYPRTADATNGGGRNSIERWGIIGIKA